jgi:TonB family protein
MSQDPKTKQAPSAAAPVEALEDAVYRPSLSASNKELHGTNPLIAIPTAIVTYACAASLIFFVATKTEAGKKALAKTIGVVLEEGDDKDEVEDLPPPPPPSAPVMALARVEVKDVPPPPPLNDQEVIPDVAPKVIPTVDYSKAFAQKVDESASGSTGLGTTVGTGSGLGHTTSTAVIADVQSSDVRVTFQPKPPPYPAMAQKAKIGGRVTVEMIIGTDGSVQSARALSGPAVLHQHAVEWAKKWKFAPYVQNDGHAAIAKFILNLDFKP